jgi:hypothetical protein
MKAETVFEVYKALNSSEQNRLLTLIEEHIENKAKTSFLESDTIVKIAKNLPCILNHYMSLKKDVVDNQTLLNSSFHQYLTSYVLKDN